LEIYQVKEFYMAMVVPVLLYGSEEKVIKKRNVGPNKDSTSRNEARMKETTRKTKT
jgi:hypothetical protein